MIKISNGNLEMSGSVATMFADIATASDAIINKLCSDEDFPNDLVELNVKALIMSIEGMATENGIDITITDDDRKNFEDSKKKAEKRSVSRKCTKATDLVESILSVLSKLTEDDDSDDDDGDDDTEDDIPDFLW